MKKFLSCMLVATMIFSMCACSEGTDETNTKKSSSSTKPQVSMDRIVDYESFETELSKYIDFSKYDCTKSGSNYEYTHQDDKKLPDNKANYELVIDGTKIRIPLTVKEFVDSGWEIVDNPDLSVDYTKSVTNYFENSNGKQVKVYVTPPEDYSSIKLGDSYASQFSFYYYNGNDKNYQCPDVRLFDSITSQSSLNDIISKLGEPTNMYITVKNTGAKTVPHNIQLIYHFGDEDIATTSKTDGYIDGHIVFNIKPITDETDDKYDYITSIIYYVI